MWTLQTQGKFPGYFELFYIYDRHLPQYDKKKWKKHVSYIPFHMQLVVIYILTYGCKRWARKHFNDGLYNLLNGTKGIHLSHNLPVFIFPTEATNVWWIVFRLIHCCLKNENWQTSYPHTLVRFSQVFLH